MIELTEILNKVKNGELTIDLANTQIIELFGVNKPIIKDDEKPVLVGHLNKPFGYNGFKLAEVGTEVYLYKDRYRFYIEPINGGILKEMSYYKETLSPRINFI